MDLVRDLLDVQVRDCRYRPCGRVDGVILQVDPSGGVSVTAIEIGAATLARRLHPRLAAWCTRICRWLNMPPARRISIADVGDIDLQLTLSVDAKRDPLDLLRGERLTAPYVGRRQPHEPGD